MIDLLSENKNYKKQIKELAYKRAVELGTKFPIGTRFDIRDRTYLCSRRWLRIFGKKIVTELYFGFDHETKIIPWCCTSTAVSFIRNTDCLYELYNSALVKENADMAQFLEEHK